MWYSTHPKYAYTSRWAKVSVDNRAASTTIEKEDRLGTSVGTVSTGGRFPVLSGSFTLENFLTALVFVAACFALSAVTIARFKVGPETVLEQEQRCMTPMPKFHNDSATLKTFPTAFEKFFDDRFALRAKLLGLNGDLKYFVFDTSPTDKVLRGLNGWFYFMDEGDKEVLRHYPEMTQRQLDHWAILIMQRKFWMDQHHIRYIVMIVPSKCTIYPENVPEPYRPVNLPSRTDQFINAVKSRSSVDILDLRPTVFDAKGKTQVFLKTDTHWSRLGSFYAYQKMISSLKPWFPNMKPYEYKDLKTWNSEYLGDLSKMMGFRDWLTESFTEAELKNRTWQYSKDKGLPDQTNPLAAYQPFATEAPGKGKPRAFVLFDSFMFPPLPFLAEHFSRAYFVRSRDMHFSQIEKEHPDVVIEEITERFLGKLRPKNYE
jgi:hypothetical protein